jgi:hypothetical protein
MKIENAVAALLSKWCGGAVCEMPKLLTWMRNTRLPVILRAQALLACGLRSHAVPAQLVAAGDRRYRSDALPVAGELGQGRACYRPTCVTNLLFR